MRYYACLVALLLAARAGYAAEFLQPAPMTDTPQRVPVEKLSAAPLLDGDATDWPPGDWLQVPIRPAVENDDKNRLGEVDVALRVGVYQDRVYFAVSWPDARRDERYREWRWSGSRYRRGKLLDDMLAIRFDLDGDYDSCMLQGRTYRVDVWRWSAGRSALSGHAEDSTMAITSKYTENAAEYPRPDGSTVYITKSRDAGEPLYAITRPKRDVFAGDTLPGVEVSPAAGGSVADVVAHGVWRDGRWTVELSRLLDTGNEDDRVLGPRGVVRGALAVFDRAASQHKSVSGELQIDFGTP